MVPTAPSDSEFHGFYLSLDLDVIDTVADGDCGLDVACMMASQPRGRFQRNTLREELSAFALKHVGNRALVMSLYSLGEMNTTLGNFNMEHSAAFLLEPLVEHHGDGATPVDQTNHTGASLANKKKFSDEAVQAITWKCQLQKESPEFVPVSYTHLTLPTNREV